MASTGQKPHAKRSSKIRTRRSSRHATSGTSRASAKSKGRSSKSSHKRSKSLAARKHKNKGKLPHSRTTASIRRNRRRNASRRAWATLSKTRDPLAELDVKRMMHEAILELVHLPRSDLLEMRRMSVNKAPESIRATFTALAITLGGEYDLADEKSSLKHLAPGKTTAWHQSAQRLLSHTNLPSELLRWTMEHRTYMQLKKAIDHRKMMLLDFLLHSPEVRQQSLRQGSQNLVTETVLKWLRATFYLRERRFRSRQEDINGSDQDDSASVASSAFTTDSTLSDTRLLSLQSKSTARRHQNVLQQRGKAYLSLAGFDKDLQHWLRSERVEYEREATRLRKEVSLNLIMGRSGDAKRSRSRISRTLTRPLTARSRPSPPLVPLIHDSPLASLRRNLLKEQHAAASSIRSNSSSDIKLHSGLGPPASSTANAHSHGGDSKTRSRSPSLGKGGRGANGLSAVDRLLVGTGFDKAHPASSRPLPRRVASMDNAPQSIESPQESRSDSEPEYEVSASVLAIMGSHSRTLLRRRGSSRSGGSTGVRRSRTLSAAEDLSGT